MSKSYTPEELGIPGRDLGEPKKSYTPEELGIPGRDLNEETTTGLGSFAKGAVSGVVPGFTAMGGAGLGSVAGRAIGTGLGALLGPGAIVGIPALGTAGQVIGGFAGALLGGSAGAAAQEKALEQVPEFAKKIGQSPEELALAQEKNPYSYMAGNIAGGFGAVRPNLSNMTSLKKFLGSTAGEGASAAERVASTPAFNSVVGAGIGTGLEGYNQYQQGEFDPAMLGLQALGGALGTDETRLGRRFSTAGRGIGNAVFSPLEDLLNARMGKVAGTPKVDAGLEVIPPAMLALPAPKEQVAPAPVFDPLMNPVGNFNPNEISPETLAYVNNVRKERGQTKLTNLSLEDIVEAGAPQQAVDNLLAYKNNFDGKDTFTPEDVLNVAAAKNVDTTSQGFTDFLRRSTGSENLESMSQPQLHSAVKALDAIPKSPELLVLPEGTNASRFTEDQYNKAIKGVTTVLNTEQTPFMDRASVANEVKDFTNLTSIHDVNALLDTAIRNGDLQSQLIPRFEVVNDAGKVQIVTTTKEAAEKAANKPGLHFRNGSREEVGVAGVTSKLPGSPDIRTGTFKYDEGKETTEYKLSKGYNAKEPEGYELTSGTTKFPRVPTLEAANARAARLTELRAKEALDIQSQIDAAQKVIDSNNAHVDQMEALGGQDLAFTRFSAEIEARNKAIKAEINKLQASKENFEQPVKVTPFGTKDVTSEGHTFFENNKPVATFPNREAAERFALSRLPESTLNQIIESAPNQKGLMPKRLAALAKEELRSRTVGGIEVENATPEGLAKLGIYTKETRDSLEAIRKTLIPALEKLGLKDVGLRIVHSIENGTADGEYVKSLITIALDAENPMGALRHEAIHALKELGAFTDKEWTVLTNKAKSEWIAKYLGETGLYDLYKKKYMEQNGNLNGFEAMIQEEAIAEAFKHFNKKAPAGLVGNMVYRVRQMFARIGSVLNDNGFKTSDDIFSNLETRGERTQKPTGERTQKPTKVTVERTVPRADEEQTKAEEKNASKVDEEQNVSQKTYDQLLDESFKKHDELQEYKEKYPDSWFDSNTLEGEKFNKLLKEYGNTNDAVRKKLDVDTAAKEQPKFSLRRQPEQKVIYEVAPDPNNKELSGIWNELSQAVRLKISADVGKNIIAKTLAHFGVKGRIENQVGSYLNDTNPSFALVLQNGNPVEISKFLGHALSQDAMMVLSPTKGPGLDATGSISIEIGKKSPEEINDIYQLLRGIRVNDEQPIGGQSTINDHMVVLNYSKVDTLRLANEIDAALGGEYTVKTAEIYTAFPEKKEYDYASSTNVGRGQEKNLRERSNSLRQEATALLEQAIKDYRNERGQEGQAGVSKFSLRAPEPRKINGNIVGSPPSFRTERDRTLLVTRMANLLSHPFAMISKSKDWYERSGATIKDVSHGDPVLMEKVLRLMSLYSQSNSLGGNVTALIKSLQQIANGETKPKAGRFPNTTAELIPAILSAQEFNTSLPGIDDKLMNFYRNLHDAAFGTNLYQDASTIDRWMMRLFGYPHAEDQEVGGSSSVSSTQYVYAKNLINRIADKYEEKTGELLTPRQIQSALWSYVRNTSEYENAKALGKEEDFEPSISDFSDYLTRATANITWESRPSTSVDLLPGIHSAPRKLQEAFNRAVRNIFEEPNGENKLFKLLKEGVLYSSQNSIGAYENQIAPNVLTRVVLGKDEKGHLVEVANKAASIIGWVTKQDAVPWYRADPTAAGKFASKGFKADIDVALTEKLEHKLFTHLNKEMPGIGFTKVDNSLDFVNFRGEDGKPFFMPDKKFEIRLKKSLETFPEDVHFEVTPFRTESSYISNDWKKNGNGEGYLERFSPEELSNIQSTIDDWRSQYNDIAEKFAKEYGWDKQPAQGKGQEGVSKFSLRAPDTPEFKEFFGDSKVVDKQGKPKLMYHGTASNISVFRAQQAKAIFVTDDPNFAETFSERSEKVMIDDMKMGLAKDIMSPEDFKNLVADSINEAEKKGYIFKEEAERLRNKKPEIAIFDESLAEVLDPKLIKYLPSARNIMPVWVRAEKPFDYENVAHRKSLEPFLSYNKDQIEFEMRRVANGDWKTIEDNEQIRDAIKKAGFDSFYVKEDGRKNLAVYEPTQIKSATGNIGTYDRTNPDIRYSLRSSADQFKQEAIDKLSDVEYKSRSKLIDMPIDTFLSLAKEGRYKSKEEGVKEILSRGDKFSNVPYLLYNIDPENNSLAKVTGHEGRHRARALKDMGYETIPVEFRGDIRWSEQRDPNKFDYKEAWPKKLEAEDSSYKVDFPVSRESSDQSYEQKQKTSDIRYSLRAPDTPEVREFMRDSTAIDKNGNPIIFYHGTDQDITTFKPSKEGVLGKGIYLTPEAKYASDYASESAFGDKRGTGGNVIPLYVNIENPLIVKYEPRQSPSIQALEALGLNRDKASDIVEKAFERKGNLTNEIMSRAEKLGHDGIYYVNEDGTIREAVAFRPNQVKSAFNEKPTQSSDIRYSLRTTMAPEINEMADRITTKRNEDGFIDRILSAISPDFRAKVRQGLIFKFDPIERQSLEIARLHGKDRLLADTSAIASVIQSMRGASVTAASFRDGIPVFRDGFTTIDSSTKGLIPILEPLAKLGNGDPYIYQLFQLYAGARRGERLNAEGREETFSPTDIARGKALEVDFPVFQTVFDEYQVYNQGLVKYMKDTGVISAKDAAIWNNNWDYIPFYRQMDDEATFGPKIFGSIAGVSKPKKLEGGSYFAVLDANGTQVKKVFDQGVANKAATAIGGSVEMRGVPLADFLETVTRNARAAIESGMKNEAARRTMRDSVELGTARLVHGKPSGNDIVNIKENGETKYYQVADPLMTEALKGLNIPQMPLLAIMAMPATLLRNMVTKEPGFILANLAKDSLSAYIIGGAKMLPIANSIKQFGKIISNNSPEATALIRAGLGGHEFSGDIRSTAEEVAKELRKRTGTRTSKEIALLPASKIWNMLEHASTSSELASRAEIFKKTMERTGGNEAEAIYQAIELMNFDRRGSWQVARIVAAIVPFLNARVQGLDVLYRAGFGKMATENSAQMHKAFIARSMQLLGLSAMYWYAVHDTDEYKELTQQERDNNWIVPGLEINGKPFKFPIPFELGVLFKVIPERIAEYSMGNDTGRDFAKSMGRQVVSTLSFNPIPQFALPLVENASNHSYFTGQQIVGRGLEGVSPEFQVAQSTSELAKKVGKELGYSPIKIDHLIQGYTGMMGLYATQMLDSALTTQGDPVNASKRFEQLPVVKRFFAGDSGTVENYYDLKKQVDEVTRTMSLIERSGNVKELKEYFQENKGFYALKGYVSSMDKNMKQLREFQSQINNNPKMSADEKRDTITKIHDMEVKMTKNVQEIRKRFAQ